MAYLISNITNYLEQTVPLKILITWLHPVLECWFNRSSSLTKSNLYYAAVYMMWNRNTDYHNNKWFWVYILHGAFWEINHAVYSTSVENQLGTEWKGCRPLKPRDGKAILTHWGRDKMAAFSQTTFLHTCYWMKMFELSLIVIKMSLKHVHQGAISNITALIQVMDWHRSGGKLLTEPDMVRLLTHICITRPWWLGHGYSTDIIGHKL